MARGEERLLRTKDADARDCCSSDSCIATLGCLYPRDVATLAVATLFFFVCQSVYAALFACGSAKTRVAATRQVGAMAARFRQAHLVGDKSARMIRQMCEIASMREATHRCTFLTALALPSAIPLRQNWCTGTGIARFSDSPTVRIEVR